MSGPTPTCIEEIQHVYYINLADRTDRKELVEAELRSIGIRDPKRFDAIRTRNGAIGCSLSHIRLLETAKRGRWPHILIVEDDIQFTQPQVFVDQANEFFQSGLHYDVVLFAGNNFPPYTQPLPCAARVTRCQTTTGYFVRAEYYDTLIENMREGVYALMQNPDLHSTYAIDKYWFRLQARDNWFLITPLTVTQRPSYSDIEKREINYTPAMLDLSKAGFMTQIKRQQRQANLRIS